jgi:hypothetical protein
VGGEKVLLATVIRLRPQFQRYYSIRMTATGPRPEPTQTSILDLIEPLPYRKGEGMTFRDALLLIVVLAAALVGVLLGIGYPPLVRVTTSLNAALGRAFAPFGLYAPLVVPLMILVAVLPAIVIHELAHIIVGVRVGLLFEGVSVGPLFLRRQGGKWRLGTRSPNVSGGFTAISLDRIRQVRRRMLLFILSGPTANLLCGTVVLLALRLGSANQSQLTAMLTSFGVLSLVIGMSNLVPFRLRSGFESDGRRLLMLIWRTPKAKRWIAILALVMLRSRSTPAEKWNRNWIRIATSVADDSIDALHGNLLAYISASARNDACAAAAHLERCLELSLLPTSELRDTLISEAAFFTAWFRDDFDKATTWLNRLRNRQHLSALLQVRMDVALCCAQRRFDDAVAKWQTGLELIQKLPVGPSRVNVETSWMDWAQEIDQRKREGRPSF